MSSRTKQSCYVVIQILTVLVSNLIYFSEGKNYTNHAILRILHEDVPHLEALLRDEEKGANNVAYSSDKRLDVLWTDTVENKTYASVRISPKHVRKVRNAPFPDQLFLTDNLQSWIDDQMTSHFTRMNMNPSLLRLQSAPTPTASVASQLVSSFRLDHYQPLSEVYRYVAEIAKLPNVKVYDIGQSHERKPIQAVEIRNAGTNGHYVWIDSCTHAREWITVAVALYIIETVLLTQPKVNIIIVPVLNPDGYEYTWTTDRMWRKNRRMYKASTHLRYMPDRCNGVDLNRNYDINFGGEGASNNPCSHLYHGPDPFSEPEVRAVAEMIYYLRNRIKLFVSLHSYNQLWAAPFAYTKDPTAHVDHHMDILQEVQRAVYSVDGVTYRIGPLSKALYVGSGFAMDWVYSKVGIINAFLAELRDKGQYGFLLPKEQILPTAAETWQGIKTAMIKTFIL